MSPSLSTSITGLPLETMRMVMGHLDIKDLLSLSGTCWLFRLLLVSVRVHSRVQVDTPMDARLATEVLPGARSMKVQKYFVKDLGPLSGLVALEELYLYHTQVSDVGPLRGLVGLQELVLNGTQIQRCGTFAGPGGP